MLRFQQRSKPKERSSAQLAYFNVTINIITNVLGIFADGIA